MTYNVFGGTLSLTQSINLVVKGVFRGRAEGAMAPQWPQIMAISDGNIA